ncbi:hypothetical protein AB0J42_24205 [Nonomuraea sp. NPDC049649]|uniref:hypothetical protein n=1 Tax=Nonomuraea sp. NPDC049649 TaxID=3155776 RepID=UPI00343B2CB3
MSAISDDVRRMARRLPGVTDRTLLELVNGLGVARGVAADSAELGVIGRLVAELTGRRHKAQLLIFQSLINGQLALTDLATESNRRSAVTDLALARVADHLRQVKETAAATRIAQQRLSFEVSELTVLVGEYIQVCDERFRELEDWRASIDLKLAADDFLADAVARADAAYAGVPWPYQAILMARHLASGSCGRWDALRTNETYRTRVTEAIFGVLGEVHAAPDRGVTFVAVLDDSWRRLHSADQRWLMAELLDAGLRPELALDRKPPGQHRRPDHGAGLAPRGVTARTPRADRPGAEPAARRLDRRWRHPQAVRRTRGGRAVRPRRLGLAAPGG